MKANEKQQAVQLRRQGLSYREIQLQLPVSQGSLSRWLRDIPLTDEQRARFEGMQAFVRAQLIERNRLRRASAIAAREKIVEEAVRTIGSLTIRELRLVGAALYWAEGCKGQLTSVVEFVNADPGMIALIMRWFRQCCLVPEEKFRARVQLHSPSQQGAAEEFWSALTGIPLHQFTRPMLKLSPSSQKKQGNHLPYGTLHIRIADVRLLMRIQGWARGLSMAPSSSPAQDVSFSG